MRGHLYINLLYMFYYHKNRVGTGNNSLLQKLIKAALKVVFLNIFQC